MPRPLEHVPDVSVLLDDPEFHHILRAVRLSAANLRSVQEDQLDGFRTALEIVEQALVR